MNELNKFTKILDPKEVEEIQKELKPKTPEELAEIQTKVLEVMDKAKNDVQKIVSPVAQVDLIISKGKILDTKIETDYLLYVVEIEHPDGSKEIVERIWPLGGKTGGFTTRKI
jgi:hypothetical protein